MPGFDGTGPRGMGPMTGGGRGYCVVPGSTLTSFWRRPMGRALSGFGRGFGGRGYGRGLGFRAWGVPYGTAYGTPYGSSVPREQELGSLREEARDIEGELERIRARMKELEG